MSRMRGVWVDPAERVAVAQPGCLLGDVDRETQLHGLATVLGFVSATGIAGLTLGGGFGYLTRRFGWTSDNVLGMDVVTATGELVRASETENPDLFWGLRGGGGNFGVMTSVRYRLHEVGPEIIGGADRLATPMTRPRSWIATASWSRERPAGAHGARDPAPGAARSVDPQGRSTARRSWSLVVCDTGPVDEAEERAAAIRAFGSPIGDIVQRRPYVVTAEPARRDPAQGPPVLLEVRVPARGHARGAASGVMDAAARQFASPHSAIILFPIDGAHQRLPGDHSAVGNRDAGVVLNISASWERPEDDDANVEWARAGWRDMRRFSTGGTYVNFLNEEEGDDRDPCRVRLQPRAPRAREGGRGIRTTSSGSTRTSPPTPDSGPRGGWRRGFRQGADSRSWALERRRAAWRSRWSRSGRLVARAAAARYAARAPGRSPASSRRCPRTASTRWLSASRSSSPSRVAEACVRAVDHRHGDGAVERDHRVGRGPLEEVVQRKDPCPVGLGGRRRPVVDRGDRGLDLVWPHPTRRAGAVEQSKRLADPVLVPASPVLARQRYEPAIRGEAGRSPRIDQEHEGEEAGHLRILGLDAVDLTRQADRLAREVRGALLGARVVRVALVEHQIHDVQDRSRDLASRSPASGTRNRAPAARIRALARTMRWAMVGSGTRNARATWAVVMPATARRVSAMADPGDSAG